MSGSFRVVERVPSVEEYFALISAVGWWKRDPEAIRVAMDRSL